MMKNERKTIINLILRAAAAAASTYQGDGLSATGTSDITAAPVQINEWVTHMYWVGQK
jgi:hypothetical protein